MTARHHHSFWTYHVDRAAQPRGQSDLRPVPQLPLDLRAIDRIAAIVTGAVLDELNECRGLAAAGSGASGEAGAEVRVAREGFVGHGTQCLDELQVLALGAAADVVDLSGTSLPQDQVDAAAVVARRAASP